mmetsp:Transcript_1556/g.3750  ORF Transcript_1556/g.3750 Transcript_1556/m.3750 type:complete len:153 (+) Transcript_1556:603-1061(+)
MEPSRMDNAIDGCREAAVSSRMDKAIDGCLEPAESAEPCRASCASRSKVTGISDPRDSCAPDFVFDIGMALESTAVIVFEPGLEVGGEPAFSDKARELFGEETCVQLGVWELWLAPMDGVTFCDLDLETMLTFCDLPWPRGGESGRTARVRR